VNPLNPLYVAVAWLIMRIHSVLSLVLNPASGLTWVLTIVVLVVLMRLIMVPLFVKQMHSMRKMGALAPQLQELRKKYKGDKQTLNEETMKLYRENGVNPLGGCLPVLGQMPMFFALFAVLRAISGWHEGQPFSYGLTRQVVESAQHANIFGATISDKFLFSPTTPTHAKVVIGCVVLISVVTTFMTVRQSTKRGMTPTMTPDNPMAASQKYMTYIIPFFALSGLYWAFGLVLYWVTTNVWTLGQQAVLFKRYPMPQTDTAGGGAGAGSAGGPSQGKTGPAKGGAVKGGTVKGGSVKGDTVKGGAAKGGAVKGGTVKTGAAKGGPQGKAPPSKKPGGGDVKTGGGRSERGDGQAPPGNGSGVLRRFGIGKSQADQPVESPEVKLVRQQRVRQSRSKRSGKR
jgi:YidC/Oxa1 family membrane protein insertase